MLMAIILRVVIGCVAVLSRELNGVEACQKLGFGRPIADRGLRLGINLVLCLRS